MRVLREAGMIRGTHCSRFLFYELAGSALLDAHSWLGRVVELSASAPLP
jgi:hypothetical protein